MKRKERERGKVSFQFVSKGTQNLSILSLSRDDGCRKKEIYIFICIQNKINMKKMRSREYNLWEKKQECHVNFCVLFRTCVFCSFECVICFLCFFSFSFKHYFSLCGVRVWCCLYVIPFLYYQRNIIIFFFICLYLIYPYPNIIRSKERRSRFLENVPMTAVRFYFSVYMHRER